LADFLFVAGLSTGCWPVVLVLFIVDLFYCC
jgi:hypothetical protein